MSCILQVPDTLFLKLVDTHEDLCESAWGAALAQALLLCGDERAEKLSLEDLTTLGQLLVVKDVAAGEILLSDGALGG